MTANHQEMDELLAIAREFLEMLRPIVDAASVLEWKTRDGFWTIVVRAVLRRQVDALEAIVSLVEQRRAHLAVPLLRPACEEFLWIAYLQKLDVADREEIVFHKSQLEAFETLNAQYDDAGDDGMKVLGFPDGFLDKFRKASEKAKVALVAMGAKLGWKLRKNQFVPSVRFVAEKTGNLKLYRLIYHATSRSVHFSVSELFRRAWGRPEELTISSAYMDGYWAQFSLCWSIRIFFTTFVDAFEEFEIMKVDLPELEEKGLESLMARLIDTGKIPIVTPEEINLHLPDPSKAFRF